MDIACPSSYPCLTCTQGLVGLSTTQTRTICLTCKDGYTLYSIYCYEDCDDGQFFYETKCYGNFCCCVILTY